MRQLRDYQLEAADSVLREFETRRSTLVVHATGLGKTVLSARIAQVMSERGIVLLLAHRVELLDQAADHYTQELGYRPQVIQSTREVDWYSIRAGKHVIVGSVQTLRNDKAINRLLSAADGFKFSCLQIDEAHHSSASSYRKVESVLREHSPDMRTFGVTATPKRTDGKALGVVFESVAHQLDAADAIDLGWLVEPIEKRVLIDSTEFGEIPVTVNEFGEADFSPAALEALMIEEGPLHEVAKPTLAESNGRKAIVFTAGVAHSHLLAGILNRERAGCAAAMDGKSTPPGHPERERIMREFRNGSIQFLCNFGIATEGTDVPTCDMVVVARPTRSKLILTQMVGRGLRPLTGVVDGHSSPMVRRAAISESKKPESLILYFSPKAANIKTATTFDALGGKYDDEVISLAKEISDTSPEKKVTEALKEAAILAPVLAQNRLRQKIKAEVQYRTEAIGGADGVERSQTVNRGGASDIQIEQLLGLGVTYATAAGYTKKQAFVVVDKLRQERCTIKQKRVLDRYGEDSNVNYHAAKRIIDEIAANNWSPRTNRTVA